MRSEIYSGIVEHVNCDEIEVRVCNTMGATHGVGTATLPGHPRSHPVFLWGSCSSNLSFLWNVCISLFVLLFFFFWTLCCLSFFDLQLLIIFKRFLCSESGIILLGSSTWLSQQFYWVYTLFCDIHGPVFTQHPHGIIGFLNIGIQTEVNILWRHSDPVSTVHFWHQKFEDSKGTYNC
jgi:hypothetical protein